MLNTSTPSKQSIAPSDLKSSLEQVDKQIGRVKRQLIRLVEKKNKLLSQTPLTCGNCKTTHVIGDLTYIRTHDYVEPHGCTGGDYWNEGEGRVDCPSCGVRLRLYNRKDLMELKYRFKNIVDEHKHSNYGY